MTLDSKVRFRTASGELVGFEGVALVDIEVAEGIGCEILFFLVKHTPTTLLRQPFITATRMRFVYPGNDLQERVFSDQVTRRECTVQLVPPPKAKASYIPPLAVDYEEEN